jgi:hypothetical protein
MKRIAARPCAVWLLMALLLSGLWPSWTHAEQITSAGVPIDRSGTTEVGTALDANGENDRIAWAPEGCSDLEMALMMILIIGDVPVVNLDSTGGGPDPTKTIVSGDSGVSSSGGQIDSSTASHTPEPATWLLALLGCVFAGGGAWVRRHASRKWTRGTAGAAVPRVAAVSV